MCIHEVMEIRELSYRMNLLDFGIIENFGLEAIEFILIRIRIFLDYLNQSIFVVRLFA